MRPELQRGSAAGDGLVEASHQSGPLAPKGVGETGILTIAPAIANAIANATGARPRSLPLTLERVLAAPDG